MSAELLCKVKIRMPDGGRGIVRGTGLLDCLGKAEELGAETVIDSQNHKWKRDGGGWLSMGIIKLNRI